MNKVALIAISAFVFSFASFASDLPQEDISESTKTAEQVEPIKAKAETKKSKRSKNKKVRVKDANAATRDLNNADNTSNDKKDETQPEKKQEISQNPSEEQK